MYGNISIKEISVKFESENGILPSKTEEVASVSVDESAVVIKVGCMDNAVAVSLDIAADNVLLADFSVLDEKGSGPDFKTNGFFLGNSVYAFFGKPNIIVASSGDFTVSFRMLPADEKSGYYPLLSGYSALQNKYISLEKRSAVIQKEYENAIGKYTEINNAFFWKISFLPRKLIGKIYSFLDKHPKVRNAAAKFKHLVRRTPAYLIRIIKAHFGKKKVTLKISAKEKSIEKNTQFPVTVKFSVLVPLYNTPKKYLIAMINSVLKQTYENFELCLADGSDNVHTEVGDICRNMAQKDSRIKYKKLEKNLGISENTNACIDMASGNYIALFDHDDLMHPSALYYAAKAVNEKNADFIYTDEVTFAGNDTKDILVYHYKPDFAIDNLRSNNYICHLSVFSKELLDSVGRFRPECDGSQDYDMILRLTEKARNIVHIPKALYFWRSHRASTAAGISAKPYVLNAAKKALADHLTRLGIEGTVSDTRIPSMYKIDYKILGSPKVSILIPNKDHTDDLDKCLKSVFDKTTYQNYEILIIENNSTQPETFEYYKKIEKNPNVNVLKWEGEFNFSAINNFGAQYAGGEHLLFLNNDIEVITPNWLEEMLMYSQRQDVGAVGVKLIYPDNTVQHGGIGIGLLTLAGHFHKGFDRNDAGYMNRLVYAQDVSAVTAACMMVRKDVFDQVGGYDEMLKVAFNDVDICMKIREKGYNIIFTPYAELYHYESKSRGMDAAPEKRARFFSEIELFHKKWDFVLKNGDPYYNPNLSYDSEDFSLK